MIFFAIFLKFFIGTNIPPFPFSKISEGPVEQLVDITNLSSVIASSKTFGKPSKTDDKINKSDRNKYG